MAKICALLAALLLLASLPFAETYSKKYVSDGWLEITRTVTAWSASPCPLPQQGVSDACMDSGARQANVGQGGALTKVALTVKNSGGDGRENIDLAESLAHVPIGAEISFSPSPSQFDGRQAVWRIDWMAPGEERSFSYEFTSSVSEAAIGRIPDAAVSAAPGTAVIFAPSRLPMNGTLTLSVKTGGGSPIGGARVLVNYPDGTRQGVKTDATGTASITATRKGSYTYSVEGYNLYHIVSTVAYDPKDNEGGTPATAASAADAGLLPGMMGALPILAAIFGAAALLLILYNFMSSRREEEDAYDPAPQLAEQQAQGMSYSQKFSFGAADAEQEKRMDDATRSMVESRKRLMQGEAPPAEEYGGQAQQGEAEAPGADGAGAQQPEVKEGREGEEPGRIYAGYERTVRNGEMDGELAELERNARIAGEVAQQEREVESMLMQLEEIRNRLRAGRGAQADEEPEAPREAVARKPKVRGSKARQKAKRGK